MANDIAGRPWRLDTASASPVWSWWIKIKQISWAGFSGAQTLLLKDVNGRTVWEAVTPTTPSESEIKSNNIGWVQGLIPATIGGGIVTIYVE